MKTCIKKKGKWLTVTFLLLMMASVLLCFDAWGSVKAAGEEETDKMTQNDLRSAIYTGTCGKTDDDTLTWMLYDSTGDDQLDTLEISGKGEMADYDDKNDPPPWEMYGSEITILKLEDGMTSIGDYAFNNGSGSYPRLASPLEIPQSVTAIGVHAFDSCSGLTGELVLPEAITRIGDQAFQDCKGLSGDLIVPKTMMAIEPRTFSGCDNIETIYLSENVTEIGEEAFNRETAGKNPKIYSLSTADLTGKMENRDLGENFTIIRTAVGDAAEEKIVTVYGDGKQSYTFTKEDLPKNLGDKIIGNWFATQTDGKKVALHVGEPVTVTENMMVKAENIISLAEPVTENGITASLQIIDSGAAAGDPIKAALTLKGAATQSGRMDLNIDAGEGVTLQPESGNPNTVDVTAGQAIENTYIYTFLAPAYDLTLTPKLQFVEHGVQLEVDGKTTGYSDLKTALNAVPVNSTAKVTLLKDITLEAPVKVEAKADESKTEVTLDMNNHSISGKTDTALLAITRDHYAFKIMGSGQVENTGTGSAIFYFVTDGRLTLSDHVAIIGGAGANMPVIEARTSKVIVENEAHIKNNVPENALLISAYTLVISGGTLEGRVQSQDTYCNTETQASIGGNAWYQLNQIVDTEKSNLSYNSENTTIYDEKNYGQLGQSITFTLTPVGDNAILELPKVTYGDGQTSVKVTKTSAEDYGKLGQALTFTFSQPESPVTVSTAFRKQQNTITAVKTSENFKQYYNGAPKSLSLKKDEDFTWQGTAETATGITYYADKEGTLTNTADKNPDNDGQVPVGVGQYYVKVIVPEDAAYLESTSDYIPFEILKVELPEDAYGVEIKTGECGKTEADTLFWTLYDKEQKGNAYTLVISGKGAMADYPDSPPWEKYRSEIVTLKLEEGMTHIGDNAFSNEKNQYPKLAGTLEIPESVTAIGENAFHSCNQLKGEIRFSENVTTIEKKAFYWCNQIGTIYIPKNVTKIDSEAFNRSTNKNIPKLYSLSPVNLKGKMDNRRLGENFTITRPVIGSARAKVVAAVYGDGKQIYTFKEEDLPNTLGDMTIEGWFYTNVKPTESGNERYPIQVGAALNVTENIKLIAKSNGHCTLTLSTSVKDFHENVTVKPMSGGDDHHAGDEIILNAPEKEGYFFKGWYKTNKSSIGYDDESKPLGTTLAYQFSITENTELVAVYELNMIDFVQITGRYFQVEYGNLEPEICTENYIKVLDLGTVVTVTALEKEDFLYWKDTNEKIMSDKESYTFTVTGQTNIILARNDGTENKAFVEFLSPYQQVMASGLYGADSPELKLPTSRPSKVGYEFQKWSKQEGEIREAIRSGQKRITVTPVYQLKKDTYKLSIYQAFDGALIDENPVVTQGHKGGSTKTITSSPVEGKRFKCWAADKEGTKILGTEEAYFLQFSSDVTLYAIYVSPETPVEKVPIIAITNVFATSSGGKHKLSFAATRVIPQGYTLVEHGMLYNKDGRDIILDEFRVGGHPEARQYKSSETAAKGVFTLNVKVMTDDTPVSARAYVIVKENKTGHQQIYYSTLEQMKFMDLN